MEQDLLIWILNHYKVFALVLVRIASILFLMPVFSTKALPVQIKAAACMVLALLLTPVVPITPDQLPDEPISMGIMLVAELFVGMTVALIIRLVFAGLQLAAQMVGFQMGFSVANIVDPQTGAQSVIITQFAYLIALLLFLAANGHHVILQALYESFQVLEPGKAILNTSILQIVTDMGEDMFVLSVKLMAPVMAILLFSQVAMGILAKTVPQINILVMSFGLNIALGLFFIGLTLQVFWPVLGRALDKGTRLVPVIIHLFAGR